MEIPSFTELNKLARKSEEGGVRIAVAGDCATQHIAAALRGYCAYTSMPSTVFDADYNQILAQVMDPESELYRFGPGYLVLIMCTEKLWEAFCAAPDKSAFAEDRIAEIGSYWQMFLSRAPSAKTHNTTKANSIPSRRPTTASSEITGRKRKTRSYTRPALSTSACRRWRRRTEGSLSPIWTPFSLG